MELSRNGRSIRSNSINNHRLWFLVGNITIPLANSLYPSEKTLSVFVPEGIWALILGVYLKQSERPYK